jgi:hypothetical protein
MNHGRQQMSQHVSRSFDIDVDHVIKFLRGYFPERSISRNGRRIVDQQIGRAEMGEHIAGPNAHGIVVGYIDRRELVERSVFGAQLFDDFLRSCATGHAVPASQIVFSQRASTAAGDARNDNVASVVLHCSESGSLHSGAMFGMKNRDEDIAIHLTFSPKD